MINDKVQMQTQTHSCCLVSNHGTYPQFCRLSCSLLPQLSVKDVKSLNSLTHTKLFLPFPDSLNWHARRCTEKLCCLSAKFLILFQSFFMCSLFSIRSVYLIHMLLHRHTKMDFSFLFSQLFYAAARLM